MSKGTFEKALRALAFVAIVAGLILAVYVASFVNWPRSIELFLESRGFAVVYRAY